MENYKRVLKEARERYKNGVSSKKTLVALEQATFNDLVQVQGKCNKCQRTDNLSLDHIIPKQVLASFGVDIEREYIDGNYQILCRICNRFKSHQLDFSIPQTKELLIKLLERV